MRRGRYLVVAYGARNSARVTPLDTTANSGHVDLFEYRCQPFHDRIERVGDNPLGGIPIAIAGRVVAITDEHGQFTVCAQDDDDLSLGEAGVDLTKLPHCSEVIWDKAIRYGVAAPFRTSGTVLDVDGSPAAHVGVQPFWGGVVEEFPCSEGNVVATTDEHGRFAVDGEAMLCGFRVFRGTTTYLALQGGRSRREVGMPAWFKQQPFPSTEVRIELRKPDPVVAKVLPDRVSGQRHWIRGSVRDRNMPVADALVEISRKFPWGVRSTHSALDGTFAIAIPWVVEPPDDTLEIRTSKPSVHLASRQRVLQRKPGDLNGVVITMTARPATAHDN